MERKAKTGVDKRLARMTFPGGHDRKIDDFGR